MVVAMRSVVKPLAGFSTATLFSLALVGAVGSVLASGSQVMAKGVEIAQLPSEENGITPVQPGNVSSTSLSTAGATQLMAEAEAAIANQDLDTATTKLMAARETLNQLSTYYQELAQMFVGVDTQLNRSHREQALEAAQMRDQASYQLALVHRAQNQPDQAVPLLMEILRSQQPTRDLGQRAYQQLFEIGFVREPYTGRTATPTPESTTAEDVAPETETP